MSSEISGTPIFLIAEIGINHNGSLELAKQIIEAASDAGFDAVKFQKRTINAVYTQEYLDSPRESPWGTTQREQKEGLEFGLEDYKTLDEHCRRQNILWSASCWDVESLHFLQQFDPPFHKVASPMLGHIPLMKELAGQRKRTFISTGMSTLDEIDQIVALFREAQCPFELMHCNSTYPMKAQEANLLMIPTLRKRYGIPVGYSGHETSLATVCVAALALGATSLERHVTLDRTMYGSDQAASIETKALRSFTSAIRVFPHALGSGQKILQPSELAAREKLRQNVPT